MKLHHIAVTALLLAAAAGSTAALAGSSKGKAAAHEARVERGRYLTLMGGCNDCHTPGTFYGAADYERTLSGSELGWIGPWGVSFPRNLTPDVETGLGSWTEQQIVDALRTGMRPDGSVLAPPMPWPMYATMTDDDAFAIAAYLKSLKPVKHRMPDKIAPGVEFAGPAMRFPPPPAWDAPRAAGDVSVNH
jgi:mono/diheme cytochrome c family protein